MKVLLNGRIHTRPLPPFTSAHQAVDMTSSPSPNIAFVTHLRADPGAAVLAMEVRPIQRVFIKPLAVNKQRIAVPAIRHEVVRAA